MQINEIEEISKAFSEAWEDYFGDKLKYVRFNTENTKFHNIYNESKSLQYDYDNAVTFYGSLKEIEKEDVIEPYGDDEYRIFTITLVTQELLDGGVFEVNHDDIITYTQVFGNTQIDRKFSIFDSVQKVQFSSAKIFTRIKVKERLSDRVYSTINTEEDEKLNG